MIHTRVGSPRRFKLAWQEFSSPPTVLVTYRVAYTLLWLGVKTSLLFGVPGDDVQLCVFLYIVDHGLNRARPVRSRVLNRGILRARFRTPKVLRSLFEQVTVRSLQRSREIERDAWEDPFPGDMYCVWLKMSHLDKEALGELLGYARDVANCQCLLTHGRNVTLQHRIRNGENQPGPKLSTTVSRNIKHKLKS